ncbi:MAG: hypothetical protein Q8L02_06895 [Candidatus Nitrotoga sp.]|nr:hypothetical protein [Candidatus Nitrotoga sp.]
MIEEIAKINNDKAHQEAFIAEKRTQARELFKDSEFAVIEDRKGFKNGCIGKSRLAMTMCPSIPSCSVKSLV